MCNALSIYEDELGAQNVSEQDLLSGLSRSRERVGAGQNPYSSCD
jgi:hypothetical protein